MAEEVVGTKYVVMREVSDEEWKAIVTGGDFVLSQGTRLFLTDGKVFDAPSGERACRDAAEESKLKGVFVYASVPERSWDPAPYELVEKVEARRVRDAAA